ncbi:MAG: helix-turn-helix domain-containing protein [Candidatus Heimdallarchaeota archaeon]
MIKEETAKKLALMLKPIRFNILEILAQTSTPLSIDSLADKIGENRAVTSFHISLLEEAGLVKGKFKIIEKPTKKKRGRVGRIYSITGDGLLLFQKLKDFLNEL